MFFDKNENFESKVVQDFTAEFERVYFFLCLSTFWISQSRLQLLFILLKIYGISMKVFLIYDSNVSFLNPSLFHIY